LPTPHLSATACRATRRYTLLGGGATFTKGILAPIGGYHQSGKKCFPKAAFGFVSMKLVFLKLIFKFSCVSLLLEKLVYRNTFRSTENTF